MWVGTTRTWVGTTCRRVLHMGGYYMWVGTTHRPVLHVGRYYTWAGTVLHGIMLHAACCGSVLGMV